MGKRAFMVSLLAVLWTLSSGAGAAEIPIKPLIEPGYVPGPDAKADEQGIWMEMAEAEKELRRSPLLVRDPEIVRFVEDVGCRIAGPYCDDLNIYVIRNPTFNASMAPNGTMLVHTGLLVRAKSTDQLASVIGHELAHYTQKHSLKRLRAAKSRMTAGMLVSMGFAVGGVASGGLPEILALSSVMGFTREQESEADLLGAYFMSEAGYRAGAGAELWQMLEAEEERASVKRPKGPLFLSSHPAPERRAGMLGALAESLDDPQRIRAGEGDPYVNMLQGAYESLMDDQVKLGDHGRLMTLVERHEAMGINPSDVAFYRGEAWRARGGAGDHQHAIEAYLAAIALPDPNPRAYRELGYLEYKHGDVDVAKTHFRRFLELEPAASDRAMIEFYLEDGWD